MGEFLKLTSAQSKWVKEEIYSRTDILDGSNLSCMSNATVRLLVGFPVNNERQFQQIASSCLQKVLSENRSVPGFIADLQLDEGIAETSPKEQDVSLAELRSQIEGDSGNLFRLIGEIQDKTQPEEVDNEKNDDFIESDNGYAGIDEDEKVFGAYRSELEYLDDQFRLVKKRAKLQRLVSKISEDDLDEEEAIREDDRFGSHRMRPISAEEWRAMNARDAEKLRTRVEKLEKHIAIRLSTSQRERNMIPRFEQICEILQLDDFARFVILTLVSNTIKPHQPKESYRDSLFSKGNTVEDFLGRFTSSLKVSVRCRKSFYKSSPLIKEGILTLTDQGQ